MPQQKITTFNKASCNLIADEMVKALAEVGERFGLKFTAAGGQINATDFICKIRVVTTDEKALEAQARADFNKDCRLFDLKPEHFGFEFELLGERYRVNGLGKTLKSAIKVLRLRDNSQRVAPSSWAKEINLIFDAQKGAN